MSTPGTTSAPALTFDDVRISYRARRTAADPTESLVAVDGVSLTLGRGETLGLAGESGCGKSTLAMSVLRLLPSTARLEGRVLIGDEDVATMRWGRLRAVRWTSASIVFQGAMHSLNPVQHVGTQIAEALRLHKTVPDKQVDARVAELLAMVDLPAARAKAYPHELSGGQKQRVMIAMALACEPEIIIADEPTTALDVVVQAQVLTVLTDLVRERGLSLVMISHDLSVLAAVCDRIAVMQRGVVVEEGPAAEVMRHPQHPHTRELAAAFPVIGDPGSRGRAGRERGEDLPAAATDAGPDTPAPDAAGHVLDVRDLVVDFHSRGQHVRAVDHVSMACDAGEIVALVGQSGSGKTTLARSILGLQPVTSGEILVRGSRLPTKARELKAFRREVQFVLQDPSASLNPKHTVYQAVAEGPRIHGLGGSERERVERALTLAELTPAADYLDALPHELSGGQRQRVVIAGALALDPSYLVADEPVASLDASVRGEILGLLLRLKRTLGLGALVITHDLGLAWNIADRVLVMHRGRIVEEGPVEQVLLDPQHEYTRSLLAVVPSELGARFS